MSVELAAYGAVSGFLYSKLPRKKASVYIALLTAMVTGRLAWGIAQFLCVGLNPNVFGIAAFWTGAVATALPGILLQIILIPVLVMALEKNSVSGIRA